MKRLSITQLVPGMTVAEDVYDLDHELLIQKGTILTDKLITKLDLYGILTIFVEDIIQPVRPAEDSTDTELSYSERIKSSPEFQLFKTDFENDVELFRENMNVALICNILAGWLKLSDEEIELATACGLFHDIGKLLIPYSIISKPGKLSEEEFATIKKHPTLGYQLLLSQDVDDHVKNAALMHHERSNGSGYPLKLKGNQIDPYARIVAIADVYDAMTAARCYRGPLCPFRVIEMFEAEGFQKYDVSILLPFLENVVNSCLQNRCLLSDGRKGTIIYINKDKLSRPVVQCGGEYVNLADQPDLEIVRLL